MKHLRKLAVLLLALVAVLAFSVTAWADEPTSLDVTSKGDGVYTVPLKKQIKVTGTGEIYSPQITYTYSIDSEVNGVPIYEGTGYVAPSVDVSSIEFTNEKHASANSYIESTGTITVTINENTTQGVYKYKIVEDESGKTAKGITSEGNPYTNTRIFIAVVTPATGGGLEVSAAYLYKKDTGAQDSSLKTEGWMVNEDLNNDRYETITVKVKKTITGDYAQTNLRFKFTFEVACTNGSKTAFASGNDTTYLAMNTPVDYYLTHNDEILIYGVPKHASATVNVKETNTTSNTYNLTTSGLTNDLNTAKKIAKDEYYEGYLGPISTDSDAAIPITFNNDLPNLSNTGLALRVAPYAIVVGAGAALVWVSRRRREENAF